MNDMNKNVYKMFSHIGMFTLGLYASSQFKFKIPIDSYKWTLTIFFTLMFAILSSKED
jgi:hypothetical protein